MFKEPCNRQNWLSSAVRKYCSVSAKHLVWVVAKAGHLATDKPLSLSQLELHASILPVKAPLQHCLLKGATGDEPAQHCLSNSESTSPAAPTTGMNGTLKAPALTSLTCSEQRAVRCCDLTSRYKRPRPFASVCRNSSRRPTACVDIGQTQHANGLH